MAKLAFMTIGLLHEPFDSPRSKGFVDRVPGVYGAADESEGFHARSDRDLQTLRHTWGPVRHPRCYGGESDSKRLPSTLSLWDDLESVAAYAYAGAHGEALAHRKEWFADTGAPKYVAFWVDGEADRLDWQEAADRLDHLHEHGPTAHAFDFKQPFDPEGKPASLDRAKIKAKSASFQG